MIKPLPTPSEFFRWCLDVADSDQIPIRRSYPKYAALGNANGYLWEHYDARIDSLGKMLSPSRRVLEIGCGLGIELHWMALHGATVLGTEVDTYSVECAKRLTSLVRQTFGRGLDVEIIRSSVLNLPQDAQFEMIYLKETLHHLEPRDAVFQRISKLLTTGGEILVLEPNALNPLIQLEMLMKRGTKTIVEAVDAVTREPYFYGNERIMTPGYIRRQFRLVGIDGTTELTRLVPTAASGYSWLTVPARMIENMAGTSF